MNTSDRWLTAGKNPQSHAEWQKQVKKRKNSPERKIVGEENTHFFLRMRELIQQKDPTGLVPPWMNADEE